MHGQRIVQSAYLSSDLTITDLGPIGRQNQVPRHMEKARHTKRKTETSYTEGPDSARASDKISYTSETKFTLLRPGGDASSSTPESVEADPSPWTTTASHTTAFSEHEPLGAGPRYHAELFTDPNVTSRLPMRVSIKTTEEFKDIDTWLLDGSRLVGLKVSFLLFRSRVDLSMALCFQYSV